MTHGLGNTSPCLVQRALMFPQSALHPQFQPLGGQIGVNILKSLA